MEKKAIKVYALRIGRYQRYFVLVTYLGKELIVNADLF